MNFDVDHAIYSEEAGHFVSSKIQRLAEIVKDFDPNLELRYIPPSMRTSADTRPYCIVHSMPGKNPYTVMYFTEMDSPEDILARIFAGDNKNGDVLRKMEAKEAAQNAFRYKEQLDQMMERHDQMHFLMTNRSNNYVNWKDPKTGQIVKLDSNRRRVT
jgi:hypothetical protein